MKNQSVEKRKSRSVESDGSDSSDGSDDGREEKDKCLWVVNPLFELNPLASEFVPKLV